MVSQSAIIDIFNMEIGGKSMDMQIGVFLGTNNKTIAFNQSGVIKVYLKDGEEWKVIKEVILEINDSMTWETIRKNINDMAAELGECRIFVASQVKGIPYVVLEYMGFNIWNVEGTQEAVLDIVFKDYEVEKLNKEKLETIPTPMKTGKVGNYFIDVKMEMLNNSNLNTKQMLLPFIHNNTFNELEIICGHVPPWFEGEFNKLNLKSEIEKMNEGTIRVKVYHR